MVVWSDGLNGSWRVSGKAILRAMHVVVAEGPGRLLTNSPGWDFISELEVLHVQAAMKQVDKIRKVMLDFIVSTKNVIFSDLTHWLIDSLTHLTHKTSVLSIFTNWFVHQVWMGSFWPTKPITVLGVSTFKRGSELASGPKLETVGSIFSRFYERICWKFNVQGVCSAYLRGINCLSD